MNDQDPSAVAATEEPLPDDNPMWESDVEVREARRRKMLFFGGSAVAVLVGFVGLYALLSWVAGGLTSSPDDNGTMTGNGFVATPGQPDAPPSIDVTLAPIGGADDLEWYAVESPLGFAQRLFASESGTFYALSTVPGQNVSWPIPQAIYRSADGENWDVISLDNTISGSDMAASRGAIYLIGTAPGSGNFDDPTQVMVNTTLDEGDSWTQALLPTAAAPPGGAPVEWSNITMRIGASSDAVIAAVQSQYFLDYRRMVPNEFVGDNYGYNPTADGVNVVDYQAMDRLYAACENEMAASPNGVDGVSEECQALFNGDESAGSIGFVTWEEMGLPDGNQPVFAELFISNDGEDFEAIESPFAPGAELQSLYATASGFVAIEWDRGGQAIWWSDDGRAWDRDESLQQFDWISSVGAVAGRTVVVGQGPVGSLAAWQNDAGGWDVVNFDEVLGPAPLAGGRGLSSAGIGPLGVVAVFQSFDERVGREFSEVLMGTSPDSWSSVPLDEITGMSSGYSDWVAVSADTVLIRYQTSGQFGPPLNLQVVGHLTS